MIVHSYVHCPAWQPTLSSTCCLKDCQIGTVERLIPTRDCTPATPCDRSRPLSEKHPNLKRANAGTVRHPANSSIGSKVEIFEAPTLPESTVETCSHVKRTLYRTLVVSPHAAHPSMLTGRPEGIFQDLGSPCMTHHLYDVH